MEERIDKNGFWSEILENFFNLLQIRPRARVPDLQTHRVFSRAGSWVFRSVDFFHGSATFLVQIRKNITLWHLFEANSRGRERRGWLRKDEKQKTKENFRDPEIPTAIHWICYGFSTANYLFQTLVMTAGEERGGGGR